MTFQEFIETYDKPGCVVLLEGKRDVLEDDIKKLTLLSEILVYNTLHMTFRSGNASGADELFCKEIMEKIPERLELITPYASHRKQASNSPYIVKHSVDEIDLLAEEKVVYNSKMGNKNDKLIDAYANGQRNRNTIKAAYLIRDTAKVVGTSTIPKASFAIFYDDINKPKQGGTGHTMKVCEEQGVPYITQTDWFEWLAQTPPFPKGTIYRRWWESGENGGATIKLI